MRARVRRPQRRSTGWRRSSRRCCSPSTATGTATRTSTGAPRWPRSAPALPIARAPSVDVPGPGDPAAGRDGWDELLRRADEPLTFDAGAVRPPAVRAVLLGHHRAAQADRARPRRHPAGAPQDAGPAPRPRARRPVLLVHHHRLDDVELPGLRAAASGATIVLFDGDPGCARTWARCGGWRRRPASTLRRSAPVPLACRKAGLRPGDAVDLSALRGVGSTGAPLPAEGFAGCTSRSAPDVQLSVDQRRHRRVHRLRRRRAAAAGVRPARSPAAASAPRWRRSTPTGSPVDRRARRAGDHRADAEHAGGLLGRPGRRRATARRTSTVFPGVWRHGDWITVNDRRPCVITGRSDATLNRGGVRLGTSRVLLRRRGAARGASTAWSCTWRTTTAAPASCCCSSSSPTGASSTTSCGPGSVGAAATELSPRHVPDEIHAVPGVPRTLSGKKLEVPVKRILSGTPVDDAASPARWPTRRCCPGSPDWPPSTGRPRADRSGRDPGGDHRWPGRSPATGTRVPADADPLLADPDAVQRDGLRAATAVDLLLGAIGQCGVGDVVHPALGPDDGAVGVVRVGVGDQLRLALPDLTVGPLASLRIRVGVALLDGGVDLGNPSCA